LQQSLSALLLPLMLVANLWWFENTPAPAVLATPPAVGDKAPDFSLPTVAGKTIKLSDLTAKSPVALIVLRGYPGYQCPYCNMQVQDFLKKAEAFAAAGVQVVLVYPGPPDNLNPRANEFLGEKKLPDHFNLLLDPGYEFTNLYGLRWDAPRETAYPSTFLIDQKGIVFFAKISKVHGGRSNAAEILDALAKKKAG
jgi:peroxiredoxin Q/BCP